MKEPSGVEPDPMMYAQTSPVLRFIRKVSAGSGEEVPDALLLERFAVRRDEEAFALLLERYGGLVLGVCRRMLRQEQDAEDAFQATFLVLARKAGAIAKRASVGSWLYGVALRTSLKARTRSARRYRREAELQDVPAPETTRATDGRELREVLDEEVNRLPSRYRVPVVLCYLEGKSCEDAARQLGCARGTVLSRLARARDRLRSRLTRRGLAIMPAAVAAVLTESAAPAKVPAALANTTLKAAIPFAAGHATMAGVAPASVTALTKGVLQAMFVTKLKTVAAVVLTIGVVGGGTVSLRQALADKPQSPKSIVTPKPPDKPEAKQVTDNEKVQGTWSCVSAVTNGKPVPEDRAKQLKLVLTKDSYTTKMGDQVLFRGTYKIDPKASPKTMDITSLEEETKGKVSKGIYAFDGDTFKLCYAVPDQERPTEFESKANSGVTYAVWKLAKP
jgi:RNA polymerase sigma factor (sigma-70 family)